MKFSLVTDSLLNVFLRYEVFIGCSLLRPVAIVLVFWKDFGLLIKLKANAFIY